MSQTPHGPVRVYSAEEIAVANATLKQEGTPQVSQERKKRDRTKDRISNLYADYKADPKTYESKFWQVVTDFAKMKLRHLGYEFEGADDYAQDIVITVMQGLTPGSSNEFKGDATNFYAWLHRICHIQRVEFLRESKKIQQTSEPLFATFNDGDGEWEGGENPEIHKAEEGSPYSMPTEVFRWSVLKNTEWVTPTDRYILKRLILGRTYEQTAAEMEMSTEALRERMRRFKHRAGRPVSVLNSAREAGNRG